MEEILELLDNKRIEYKLIKHKRVYTIEKIKDTGITGVVVMKIGSIYQVEIGNAVSSYTYDEIEIRK